MEISIRHTDLKPTSIRTLLSNGIVLLSHLNTFDVLRLSSKTRLPIDECEKILAATKPKRAHFVMKASDLVSDEADRLTTLKPELDMLLGGGVRCGCLTEISGEAGAGKSNLTAEIGVMVMLPKEKGGRESKVMLIHTEGEGKLKLAVKRFKQLISSVIPDNDDIIRNNLQLKNCFNELELIEMINRLPKTLNDMPEVKLIIIDSITCAFIQVDREPDYQFYAKRDLKLTKLAKVLLDIAARYRVSVLLTNHVSYDLKTNENRPALGKVWSHMCQTKIYIERVNFGNQITRFAHVTKGANQSSEPIKFDITRDLFD